MPDLEKPESLPRPAPNGRLASWDRWWLLLAVVIVAIISLVGLQPNPYANIVRFLLDGMWVTVWVTIVSYVCILAVGLIAGLGRVVKSPLIRGIASIYVEVVRGVPLLVQIYYIYYVSPAMVQSLGRYLVQNAPALSGLGELLSHWTLNPFAGAVFGLTFCYGAYVGEIYRAGIESIPRGQMEAARSLGMSYVQAMRHVILPQAIRTVLPPLGNEFVALLKDSSLVSVVAVSDMTRRGREMINTKFIPIETWTMVALLYLVLTVFAARIVAYIERKSTYAR